MPGDARYLIADTPTGAVGLPLREEGCAGVRAVYRALVALLAGGPTPLQEVTWRIERRR